MSEQPKTLIARLEINPAIDHPAQLALYRTTQDVLDNNDCAILELNAEQLTKLALYVRMQPFNLDLNEYQDEK